MDPWNLMTPRVPARSWRPSTFCVTHENVSKRRLQFAKTSWARLGAQAATTDRRHAYHSHTSRGLLAKASGVAKLSGRT